MKLSFASRNKEEEHFPPEVLLASQSIGRKMLLEKLGLRFRTTVTRVNEDAIVEKDPIATLKRRASAKAAEVLNNPTVFDLAQVGETLLITADSMAIIGTHTFGKARDRADATLMLKSLMDRSHTFATAVTLVHIKDRKEVKRWEKVVKTKVTLRKLTTSELDLYISRYDFTRFAAGYALNETPWNLVTKIDGSYTNVIGLPFEVLLPVLRKLKIIL
ncbi:Maf family protein [Patescibacteria group bacterium]|nr:Maf family protein [Patescibacteria group bacterium]MBU1472541.1 Maf family protein [Patescibacteria group bacterium]MBU2460086.1 Maf family protein [Patescibacteria group bacterium]MBU2544655.1 Maf family protein [Patescibacteria group bacterium]